MTLPGAGRIAAMIVEDRHPERWPAPARARAAIDLPPPVPAAARQCAGPGLACAGRVRLRRTVPDTSPSDRRRRGALRRRFRATSGSLWARLVLVVAHLVPDVARLLLFGARFERSCFLRFLSVAQVRNDRRRPAGVHPDTTHDRSLGSETQVGGRKARAQSRQAIDRAKYR